MQLHCCHALDALGAETHHEYVEEVLLFLSVVAREEDYHHVQAVQSDLHVSPALDVCKHGGCDAGDCTRILAHHDERYFMVFKCEFFPNPVDVHREYHDAHLVHDCRNAR